MFQKLFQVVFAVGLLFMSAPAQAIIMREDVPSSAYEAYGQQSQFQSVGWIGSLQTDGHVHAEASGVYLGDGWVLTCAHVITTATNKSGFLELQFGLGPNFLTDWTPGAIANAWYVHPDYSYEAGPGQTPDLALVHLITSLSVSPAVLYSGTPQVGDAISMVGYGNPGTNSTGQVAYDGEKRGGTNIVSGFGEDGSINYSFYSSDFMFADYDSIVGGAAALECMAAQHDSGGGVFIPDNDQTYLAGLMAFYTGTGAPGTLVYHDTGIMNVTGYTGWINETMAAVPEPGTLILFASGALAFLPRLLRRRYLGGKQRE